MSWNTISISKLLEKTEESLAGIKESLSSLYGGEVTEDEATFIIASAFTQVSDWLDYYSKHNNIVNTEIDNLKEKVKALELENKRLETLNKACSNQCIQVVKENKELSNKVMHHDILVNRIKELEEILRLKNESTNMVPVDIVEMIDKLESIHQNYEASIKLAEHKASMKEFNRRVATGEVKPAKRADIDDDYIVECYNKGVSAYKIAKSVGMTQQAILYRIKKLKETGIIQ